MSELPAANHIQLDPNFIEDGIAELPQFLQTKANYRKLTKWYCKRWEAMDGEVIKLAYLRMLDNASGLVLDMLGSRIGIFRYDQSDVEYRALIKLRSFRQTTGASRADIVTLMKILFFGENPFITKRQAPLVVKASNTTTMLDGIPYIYDPEIQKKTWLKPSGVALGDYIISVDEDELTTTSGVFTMTQITEVPSSNSFIDIVIPANCLSDKDVAQQLEDMFPVNTNLWVSQADATIFYFVDSKDGVQPDRTGGLSDSKELEVQSLLTNWIHSSARAVKNT